MIMFDGTFEGTNLNDVWSLSTSGSPQWTEVFPAGSAPPARLGQSGVYDSTNSRIMMFGGGLGQNLTPCANDVWVLSNANSVSGTPTWNQLSPTGTPPPARIFHTAVYIPSSNSMIVFGGTNCSLSNPQFYNDVWVLSNANGLGGTPAWTQLSLSGGPTARQGATAVYDPASNRMIVFGGYNTIPFSDVWVLTNPNGASGTPAWAQLSPGGSIPPRDFHSAVYDSTSNRMTVFGGVNVGQLLSDTWTLAFANGTGGTPSWSQLNPSTSIPATEAQTAVYDAAGNRLIIFGGITVNGYANLTWVLSNAVTGNLPPQAVSVSPATGSGISQTFSFVFSDANGASDLTSTQVIFNASLSGVSSCYLYTVPASGAVYLANNADSGFSGPLTLGSGGTLQNSQCSINMGASSGVMSGNTYTMNLAVTFQSGFAGHKSVFGFVLQNTGGLSSGWQTLGAWTVPTGVAQPPTESVSPLSGSGVSQTFSFAFTDVNGASDLTSTQVIFNAGLSGVSGCYLYTVPSSGAVYLANNADSGFSAPLTLGVAGTLQNSQCSINMGASSGVMSGNTYTMNLAVTFQAGFTGAKGVFGYVLQTTGGLASGWQQLGTWTVPVTAQPPTESVSPLSGSGLSQTFAFAFTDVNGASDLVSTQVIFNAGLSGVSGCYLYTVPASGAVYLANNADSGFSAPLTLGVAGTLQNSQCSINMGASSGIMSGNTYTMNLAVTFQTGFAGAKGVFGYVLQTTGGLASGWQQLGTWTVPSGAQPPTESVSPLSGSGVSQTFSFAFTDVNGASDLASTQVLFNAGLNAVSACYIYTVPASGAVYLANNADSGFSAPLTLGVAGTLQNSQCSINMGASSGVMSGNTYTMNLAITFQTGFTGAKGVFGYVLQTTGGLASGWQQLGTWTP